MPNAFVRKLGSHTSLTVEEACLLAAACDASQTVPAHRDLIREGNAPGPVFVMLEGWACRYKVLPDGSRQIMAFIMPGDFCDLHTGLLEEMDHSVATITACEVAFIPHEKMEALIVATPGLTRAFWKTQLVDQGVLRAWIVSMGRRGASQRIAHLMLELYVRMRTLGLISDGSCQIPLTQTVVADALGLTPVHTNRMLRNLRERGVMEFGAGTLTIPDIRALAKVAGFDENYLHQRIKQRSL